MPPISPNPTYVYRLVHVANLSTLLGRRGLHAPNTCPEDGLPYQTIHDVDVQTARHVCSIPCGPGGVIHDYVPFYFGPLSPMLLRLHTGRVAGHREGQQPLVYLVTTAQDVLKEELGLSFRTAMALPSTQSGSTVSRIWAVSIGGWFARDSGRMTRMATTTDSGASRRSSWSTGFAPGRFSEALP